MSTPTLPGQVLTEIDHENILTARINELILEFLRRPFRRRPCRPLFGWTFNDHPTLSYNVVLNIEEQSLDP